MKVLLYGRLADAIGREVEIDASAGCSVGEIRERLAINHPAAVDALSRSRALIGSDLVGDQRTLAANEVAEFLPPVSGG